MSPIALAIHGGCGVLPKTELTDAEWAEARADLTRALQAGHTILSTGGSAVDAVEAAVMVLEDSPHFNAGHGAALNADFIHELDASIMDGASLAAGAVTLTRHIRNPVCAARAVMAHGDFMFLGGQAADDYARAQGLAMVEQSYFSTPRRIAALSAMKAHAAAGTIASASEGEKHGTVGAVALDRHGHLAAATSTGGFNNKAAGRIGDTPVIGAGTYARDGACAVSCTGQGEYFIRHAVAHDIVSRVVYLRESIVDAADHLMRDLAPHGIGAGLIVVGADGSVTLPFNTDGMFRGWVKSDGVFHVATHR